jgi:organic radical activating enzyme
MQVKEIFASLQGEGPDVGTPAVFVRLAGCNLCCDWCDTDHQTNAAEMTEEEIVFQVCKISPPNNFVVITGGEPFLQPLNKLLAFLLNRGFRVQLETNGTLWQEELRELLKSPSVTVVCSPKDQHEVHRLLTWFVSFYKIVYGADDTSIPKCFGACFQVFIQPRDDQDAEKNNKNLQASIQLCLEKGWRLSLQTHKMLGLQ